MKEEEDHHIIVQEQEDLIVQDKEDLSIEDLIHFIEVILNEQNIHKLLKKNYIIFIKF
jgi:hypothetical protein